MPVSHLGSGKMDHLADTNGAELYRLSRLYDFPDFVKKADFDKVVKPREISVNAYADPVRRQFPCDNAASTWLSAVFFNEKKAEFHVKDQAKIQQRLDSYVDYWRIRGEIDSYQKKYASYHRSDMDALPDSTFGWVEVLDNGHRDRRLPLRNAIEVKTAADWLFTYRDQIPFADRHVVSTKILQKAAQYGAGIAERLEFLEKQAGRGVCNPDEVCTYIKERAYLTKDETFRRAIVKLAMDIKDKPRQALCPDMLVELCKTVEAVDKTLGLVGKYTDKIPRPEDFIFSATFCKVATEMSTCCALTSGTIYEKKHFSKLALDDIRTLFGDEFAEEVKKGFDGVDPEKVAEIAATLPVPDAELFDKMANEAGIHAKLVKAASAPIGFGPKAMEELAKIYEGVYSK